ncbi:ABC transporter substrate-binding protein [Salinisphaera sp. SWV1]|uniref:ABC transporter substrate-binding protein n=1 Tax=Salinisphaera sp. SWV1 TaxID=3454139 RepID=UPI003F847AD5
MNRLLRTLGIAAALALVLALPNLAVAQDIPSNLRIVIGSKSTGGDTYQNSEIVANALAKQLGINVKVDAVGVNRAFRALSHDSRGTTMMIFHDQAYLGNLYGVPGYPDIFKKYVIGPTLAINPGNAYLVPKDSPYKTPSDLIKAAAAGKRIRVAIQAGGVSEIGFSALKNAARLNKPGSENNIIAVHTGSQADKNQLLFQGQADVINGSVQANEQFTQLPASDRKAMRFIWLTARHKTIEQAPAEGMGHTTRAQLLQHVTPNVHVPMSGKQDFTFDKEFFFIYNKKMDPTLVRKMDQALKTIYAKGDIQKRQKAAFFIPDFMPSKEATIYLKNKKDTYRKIINEISGSKS